MTIRTTKAQISLCILADWFESYLVRNPEIRFSGDEAHINIDTGMIDVHMDMNKIIKNIYAVLLVPVFHCFANSRYLHSRLYAE